MKIAIIIVVANLIGALVLRAWCDRKTRGHIDKWKKK